MADEDEDDDAGGAKGGGPEEEDDEEASSVSGGLSLMHLELSEEDQPAMVPYEEVRLSSLGGAICGLWCGAAEEGKGRGEVPCVQEWISSRTCRNPGAIAVDVHLSL